MSGGEEKIDLHTEADLYDALDGFEYAVRRAGTWMRDYDDTRSFWEFKRALRENVGHQPRMFLCGLDRALKLPYRQLAGVADEIDPPYQG